uniref:Uncharacterized protein n=1 Tax=Gopherus evgoodei TaxID=1825980 RepID=A0A8C4Y7V1_9SAUR
MVCDFILSNKKVLQINKAQERQCEAFCLNKIWETHVLNVKTEIHFLLPFTALTVTKPIQLQVSEL